MSPRDLTGGLPDLDGDAPAGPNLEFDPSFGELERAAQGKPEQQYGGTIIPAEEPNWKEVAGLAEDLLDRTRDLRVLVTLAVARLQLKGLVAFVEVVGVIRDQLEARWPYVHPQLDPEDDNDPTFRANALLPLGEPLRVLRPLRTLALATSRRDGPVSWRTVNIFNGIVDTEDSSERKTEQVIRAAFAETGVAQLTTILDSVNFGQAQIDGIDAVFNANSGYGNGPDLSNLSKLLREIGNIIGTYMPAEDPADAGGEVSEQTEAVGGEREQASGGGARPGVSIASLTAIHSREDAMRLLDLVVRYYETQEPSSPLPLLIGRARKLADKGFLEILQDIAPDGLMQAQSVVRSRDD